jgi:hypothetical protein
VAGGIRRQGEREGMSDSGGRQRFKKERKKDIRDTWKESKIDSGTVVSNTIMYRCTLSHVEQTAGELGTLGSQDDSRAIMSNQHHHRQYL